MKHLFSLFTLALLSIVPLAAAAQVHEPSPFIERLEPTSGPPGTTVQMVGRYFRPNQIVRLGDFQVEVLARMPNRWTFRIPTDARSGRIVIDIPATLQVIGPEFRVLAAPPPPMIRDVQPRSAAPGSEVRIVGENFSPRITENSVTLGSQPIAVRSATPTELVVIVPQGAVTGRFSVRVAGIGEASASVDLTIGAGVQISAFNPSIIAPGGRVQIDGVGFAGRPTSIRAMIGTTPCRVISASPTSIVIEIPAGASSGTLSVEIPGIGRAYSTQTLAVQAAPIVSSFDPPAGPTGSLIRIQGSNFGTDIRVVQVTFATVPATIRGLSPNEITAEVPAGASSGAIAVTINGVGPATSRAIFSVLTPPRIADFAPRFGGPGTDITITGSGFSSDPRSDRVSISGVACQVLSATANELRVRIPRAASGPLTIDVEHAGTARTAEPFVVTNPPQITGILPERGTIGSVVTINGSSFGTNPSLVEVSIGDRRMEIRSLTDQQILAVIPSNGINGRIRVTVRLQGTSSSEREFLVLGEFAVSAIDPTSAYPGQRITIRGAGFTAQGMQVRFTGARDAAAIEFRGPNELRLLVPAGATTGPLIVRATDGREIAVPFTLAPAPGGIGITEIVPACLNPGCIVVVRGYGFSPRVRGNRVIVGTTSVRVARATPFELQFALPRTPGTMTIRIEIPGQASVESAPITITR